MGSSVHKGTDRDAAESPRKPHRELEAIFEEYVERINRGEALDSTEIRARYPHLAAELIERLEMFELVDESAEGNGDLGTLADYTLLSEVGRGGMGVVYEAWENSMDRRVALKVIPPAVAADSHTVTRFVREARVAGNLQHPHVVPVFAMGIKDKTPYYAMEFVEGETLAQIITSLKAAEPDSETVFGRKDRGAYFETVADAFAEVADGLQHAHSKGVVHRDIKPSNLIFDAKADQGETPKGRLRVLDFGLARLEGEASLTISGGLVGTPVYMSPEQADGRQAPVDHRSDIYSLGATLYEALTLEPPFHESDRQQTLSQIIGREPRPPRERNPRIPGDLETIVLKCLRKKAADRYGTAEALAQDLRRFARGDPIEARPESRPEKIARYLRRNRRVVSVGAALFVCALAALILGSALIWKAEQRARAALEESRWQTYVASVAAAGFHVEDGAFVEASRCLEVCPVEFRGFEWHHARLEAARLLMVLDAGTGSDSIVYSPDGKQLASGQADTTVRLWDAESGRLLATLEGHEDIVHPVAYRPDGKRLVSGGDDKTVRVWDVESGELLFTLRGHERTVRAVVYHPDGKRIASASHDKTVRLWDAERRETLATLKHDAAVRVAAFDPGGRRLASGGRDGMVRLWETDTGRLLTTFRGHTGTVTSLDFSPDGKRIVSGSYDRTLRLWDVESGECLEVLRGHNTGIWSTAYSPDGKRIVSSATEGVLRLWDALTGEPLQVLKGHEDAVYQVAWRPDSERIASASMDSTVRIWDAARNRGVRVLAGHEGAVESVAWSPDGERIASGAGDNTLRLWDVDTGKFLIVLRGHGDRVQSVAWSPDGKRVASGAGDHAVRLWDVRTGRCIRVLEGHEDLVKSVAYSPDGTQVASGSFDRTVRLWNAATGELRATLRQDTSGYSVGALETKLFSVRSVAFSPDGDDLVCSAFSIDTRAVVWDVQSERPRLTLPVLSEHVSGVSFSPDGQRLVCAAGTTIERWDATSGTPQGTLHGHANHVTSVAFSRDGARLVSGSKDRTLRIWGWPGGEPLAVLRGHEGQVLAVAFSPDGKRIVSGSSDGTIRIWESEPQHAAQED